MPSDLIADSGYTGARRRASLVMLVLANLLPVYGVLFLDWDIAALVVLYWSENLVLGFYTLAKMLVVSPVGSLFYGVFFSIHYGGFCAVHGLFILIMLINPEAEFLSGDTWPFFFVFLQLLVDVCRQVLAAAPDAWLYAFAALLVSHGVSFLLNFLVGGERDASSIKALMAAPYGRIVILHITIILGAFAAMALGQPLALLLILVALKLALDVTLHLREHRKLATADPRSGDRP